MAGEREPTAILPMNRADRRAGAKVCRKECHVIKTDGNAEPLPTCERCGVNVEDETFCGCCGVNRTEQLFCSTCSTHLLGGETHRPWDRVNPNCPVRVAWESEQTNGSAPEQAR